MDNLYKLRYNVITELDVFITLLREKGVIEDKATREFIRDIVIPRLTQLRITVGEIQ